MGSQMTVQIAGILAVAAWSAIATWVVLKISDLAAGMRVSADQEPEGLDTVLHNEKGYNL
jgi:ammonium transporter, Amt family